MNELLVIVHIAGRRCALQANEVQSVIEIETITPIPRAPKYVAGLTTLRSQALTVIDCRTAIGFDPAEYMTEIRAPVVSVGGHSYALMVDRVEDVVEATSDTETVIGGFGKEWERVSQGMAETAEGPVLIFDFKPLFETPTEELRVA